MRETVRVTVTMPTEQVDQVRQIVGASGAGSISAYVAAAVGRQLDRDRALARLRQLYRERGVRPDAEHHAWARQILGITDDDVATDAP